MVSSLNNYYFTIINDILTSIIISKNGKRHWFYQDDKLNYSLSTESTYPDYLKFFFVKTPKNLRINYLEESSKESWEDGYFNGNRRELLRIFKSALDGYAPKSKRLQTAFDMILEGYFKHINDFEEQYKERFYSFDELDFTPFPF